MRLGSNQLADLAARRRSQQAGVIVDFLYDALPQEIQRWSRDALMDHCLESVDIAEGLGLEDDRSVAWLATVRLLVHPRVHEHPALRGFLADPSMLSEDRVERLLAEASALDWQEAAAGPSGAPATR